jgi:hypothetical protein
VEHFSICYQIMVREKGLEPSRPEALAPKASVSTNSTTRAFVDTTIPDNARRIKLQIYHAYGIIKEIETLVEGTGL